MQQSRKAHNTPVFNQGCVIQGDFQIHGFAELLTGVLGVSTDGIKGE
jgi:hypothetical protein